jgi:AraC family transcriptional regulator
VTLAAAPSRALPRPLLDPLRWGETLSAPPVFSARLLAGTPILVRRWRGVSPVIAQPPLDHHYVTLHLGGGKRIGRRGEGANLSRDVEEGSYSVTPAGSAFDWCTEGPVDFAHVYLPPGAVRDIASAEFDGAASSPLQDVLGARDPLLQALLGALTDGVSGDKRLGALYLEGLLHTFVCRLLQVHAAGRSAGPAGAHILAPFRVRRVTDFVEAGLAEDLSLADLASVAGISVFHFTRGFHRATGFAPYAYLIHRRLERAKTLLQAGELPLDEVAAACGFRTTAQFASMFRRRTGLAPGRYRNRR